MLSQGFKKRKPDYEKIFKDYQNTETGKFNLEILQQKDDNQIIDLKLQIVRIEKKLNFLKYPKNAEEIQEQPEINFSYLLEGHI